MELKKIKNKIKRYTLKYKYIIILLCGLIGSIILIILYYDKIPYLNMLIRVVLIFTPFLIISISNLSKKKEKKTSLLYLISDLIVIIKLVQRNSELIIKHRNKIKNVLDINRKKIKRMSEMYDDFQSYLYFVEKFNFLAKNIKKQYNRTLLFEFLCKINKRGKDYFIISIDKYKISREGIYDLEYEKDITSNEDQIKKIMDWMHSKYLFG